MKYRVSRHSNYLFDFESGLGRVVNYRQFTSLGRAIQFAITKLDPDILRDGGYYVDRIGPGRQRTRIMGPTYDSNGNRIMY